MTKFGTNKDTGYIRVSNRLKLWVNDLADTENQIFPNEASHSRTETANPASNVLSGGGPVFMAPLNAGRDINTYNGMTVSAPQPDRRLLSWTGGDHGESSHHGQIEFSRAT